MSTRRRPPRSRKPIKITGSHNRSSRVTRRARVTGRGGRPKPTGSAKVTQASNGRARGNARVTASGGGSARSRGGPSRADAANWRRYNQSARTSGRGPVKGSPGTQGAPSNARRVTRSVGSQNAAHRMKRTLRAAQAARRGGGLPKGAGRLGAHAAVVGAVAAPRRLADGTLKGKPTGPKKGPAVPKRRQATNQYKKGTFNHAFKAARNAGKKEFTFNGKKYAVKLK